MPPDWQAINSTSLTLSSKLLSISQWPLTSEAKLNTLCLDSEPLSFLTDPKHNCRDIVLSCGQQGKYFWVQWGQVTVDTGDLIAHWYSKVCSLAICLQLVHIFQSTWFEILWALVQWCWFSFHFLSCWDRRCWWVERGFKRVFLEYGSSCFRDVFVRFAAEDISPERKM